MVSAQESTYGVEATRRGTSPAPGAANQATAPPGNGTLDGAALAHGLDRLEQAGAGH
jgi:hypothetical protein